MAAPAEAHAAAAAAAAGLRLDYDVIVVGAGIMGSCAAHAAASRGAHTLLLERFDLLHQLGSSHGDSRIIRDAYVKAQYPPMVRLARRLWADAEAESGYRVLTPAPHLSMGPRGNAALLAAIKSAGAEDVDLSQMWGGAFQAPAEGWVTAVSERGGGVLNATKAVAMFQALAVKMGAVVRDNAEVVDIRKGPEGGVVVTTSAGEEFCGAKCVVTVGAWTTKLLRSVAGVEIPIQPLHTLTLYWRIKPGCERGLTAKAGFPTFSSYGDTPVYGTPSLELPGLIKISCDGGPPCDPDNRDWASGDREITDRVARWIQEFMPGHVDPARGPVVRQSCICSMTPDKDFVIDWLGGEFGEDVVVGAGFSGHGFKMGPAVGRILAEMAIDGEARTAVEAGVELGHFKINRFNGNKDN
ncbi:probable sarcosine oxidase [Miscanthus floridulus]|uniref:probable sarcosine oxidase n=1 Tax=Miscanthus floridulus TaxID=154761 RepID=UPI00345B3C4A